MAACRSMQEYNWKFLFKTATLHTILLGVGGTCYTEHTLNQFNQQGLDHQHAIKLARKLHAHSVVYANKIVTSRRAENNNALATHKPTFMLLQIIKQTKPLIAWLILGSLAQAPAEILFLIYFGKPKRKRKNTMPKYPQLLHPILKSPTSTTFKILSSLTCIQSTDLDMPTPKQATIDTIRVLLPHVEKNISNAFKTCPVYPHL
eukprot:1156986-Pelagomonas_calceolata.AAC.3